MNDSTVSILRKLKDLNGAYLWQPSVQAGQPDKLLGYDLYTSPYAPTVEAGALAIAFGDFRNYWIGDRAGRTVQRLNELYANLIYQTEFKYDTRKAENPSIQCLHRTSAACKDTEIPSRSTAFLREDCLSARPDE